MECANCAFVLRMCQFSHSRLVPGGNVPSLVTSPLSPSFFSSLPSSCFLSSLVSDLPQENFAWDFSEHVSLSFLRNNRLWNLDMQFLMDRGGGGGGEEEDDEFSYGCRGSVWWFRWSQSVSGWFLPRSGLLIYPRGQVTWCRRRCLPLTLRLPSWQNPGHKQTTPARSTSTPKDREALISAHALRFIVSHSHIKF